MLAKAKCLPLAPSKHSQHRPPVWPAPSHLSSIVRGPVPLLISRVAPAMKVVVLPVGGSTTMAMDDRPFCARSPEDSASFSRSIVAICTTAHTQGRY